MITYLQVENLTKSFGDHVLFENISFSVMKDQKTALIAKNGAGKSTLLNIISKKESQDSGQVVFKNDIKVGYLPQAPELNDDLTVREQIFSVSNKLAKVVSNYEAAVASGDANRIEKAQNEMDANNAWDYEFDMQQILGKLCINNLDQKISTLSGGQKKRIALADALIEQPDLLILDEPTNHLDMRSKDVLKEAIRAFDGTVILVSHDRDFLDGIVSKVYEFGGGKVREHLCGIYEFLQKKQLDNLNQLQTTTPYGLSTYQREPDEKVEIVSEGKINYQLQKEQNRKQRKLERQVAECEAKIEHLEQQIKEVEEKLSTVEGATDPTLYVRYQELKDQVAETEAAWEQYSMELEEL